MRINGIGIKGIIAGVAVVGGILLGMNSYTVVQDGTVKTSKLFGQIQEEYYTAGIHIVNPMADMTRFNIKENMFSLDNVSIPSQDKFKSDADITVKWSIKPASVVSLQRDLGSHDNIQQVVLEQPLLSILREAGRDVEKAQDLFKAVTQDKVQTYVLDELKKVASPYGVEIHAVYMKDINLPKVIQRAIIITKQLEEKEAQEMAKLAQQKLVYARQTAEAEAKAKSAEQDKIATKLNADGEKYRVKAVADGIFYAKSKEAQGNKLLSKSSNKDLLALKALDVDLVRAQNWKGGCTENCTELGASSSPATLYHMGSMNGK